MIDVLAILGGLGGFAVCVGTWMHVVPKGPSAAVFMSLVGSTILGILFGLLVAGVLK